MPTPSNSEPSGKYWRFTATLRGMPFLKSWEYGSPELPSVGSPTIVAAPLSLKGATNPSHAETQPPSTRRITRPRKAVGLGSTTSPPQVTGEVQSWSFGDCSQSRRNVGMVVELLTFSFFRSHSANAVRTALDSFHSR